MQMEKDETVSDCSPHIANIGRLVEVSGPPAAAVRLPGVWRFAPGACLWGSAPKAHPPVPPKRMLQKP